MFLKFTITLHFILKAFYLHVDLLLFPIFLGNQAHRCKFSKLNILLVHMHVRNLN